MDKEQKKKYLFGLISDSVGRLLYYDRKECSTFGVGDIEKLIEDGVITVDEMVNKFKECIGSGK